MLFYSCGRKYLKNNVKSTQLCQWSIIKVRIENRIENRKNVAQAQKLFDRKIMAVKYIKL